MSSREESSKRRRDGRDQDWRDDEPRHRRRVPMDERDDFDEWRRERSDRGRKRRRHRDRRDDAADEF